MKNNILKWGWHPELKSILFWGWLDRRIEKKRAAKAVTSNCPGIAVINSDAPKAVRQTKAYGFASSERINKTRIDSNLYEAAFTPVIKKNISHEQDNVQRTINQYLKIKVCSSKDITKTQMKGGARETAIHKK